VTLTKLLIAVNVIAFIWQLTTRGGIGYDHGEIIPMLVLHRDEWWRIFTAAFLHGGIPHVAINMIALYVVGNPVEELFGKFRFALLYVLAIIGSGLAVVYFSTPDVPTLGASGAIYGLFGALVAVGLRLGARGRSLIGQVLPIIAINLVFTFAIPGISVSAHLGGLITGFVVGLVLFMVPSRQREYAYAASAADPAAVETIEQPPDAGPHEEAHAAPLEQRDPRE
jgi:membrane associated rhomboid family serine protease